VRLSASGVDRILKNVGLVKRAHPQVAPSSNKPPKRTRKTTTSNKQQRNPTPSHDRSRYKHTANRVLQRVAGQCDKCGETNHVTKKCKHEAKVQCFLCGSSGHKSKHHTATEA